MDKTKLLLYTRDMVDVKTETAPLGNVVDPDQTRSTDPDSFSIAHLSDLHLTSLNNIKIFPQLLNKRLLGYLSWLHKRRIAHRRDIIEALLEDLHITRPEQIAITGDLTHLGLPMEYAEVSEWLPSLGTPEQVTVIPGNHEAYAGRNWFRSCAMWAPYLQSDNQRDLPGTKEFFPSLRIRGQIAFIGLCSAKPSLPLLATGSLGPKQLSGLEALLHETGGKGLLRIVLIHHPPVAGIVNWRKRLTDSKALSNVLSRHGAEMLLHGHSHSPAVSRLETPRGAIPVIGAPSASELSPWTGNCAKYNIYRIKKSSESWELTMSVRGYSEELGRFAPEEETVLDLPHLEVAGSRED